MCGTRLPSDHRPGSFTGKHHTRISGQEIGIMTGCRSVSLCRGSAMTYDEATRWLIEYHDMLWGTDGTAPDRISSGPMAVEVKNIW